MYLPIPHSFSSIESEEGTGLWIIMKKPLILQRENPLLFQISDHHLYSIAGKIFHTDSIMRNHG